MALVTTFFGLINTLFFRALPYPHAERTVSLAQSDIALQPLENLQHTTQALSRIAVYRQGGGTLSEAGDDAQWIPVSAVDTALFSVLDVQPIRGRVLQNAEIARNDPVLVIGEALWRTRFGAREDIVGQELTIDGISRTIVGVMPAWFTFPNIARAWYPISAAVGDEVDRGYQAIGVLRPGHSIDEVAREAALVMSRLRQVDSSRYSYRRIGRFNITPDMVDRLRRRRGVATLTTLFIGGAVCVLLVACTNVASLMLVRGARRRGQTVIRAALGASRWQLMRPQLLESLMLAGTAGATGTLLSIWGGRLMLYLLPSAAATERPGWLEFGIDSNVALFAALLSLLTVFVFGLWPARVASGIDLAAALRASADAGTSGADPSRRLHLPVVLELGLSLSLFVAAAMMLRSFHALSSVSRGYVADDRYRVLLSSQPADSLSSAYTDYVRALERRVAAITSADVAIESSWFVPGAERTGPIVPETGRHLTRELGTWPMAVSPNYFRVMGMSIVSGRSFDSSAANGNPTMIVSRSFAKAVWGREDVIGRYVRTPLGDHVFVIGMVNDRLAPSRTSLSGLAPTPQAYVSLNQALASPGHAYFLVHSTLPLANVRDAFNYGLKQLGRSVFIEVRSLNEEERQGGVLQQTLSMVFGTFAIAGLGLALMGIYGVVGFAVEQRTREIGIRVALGAPKAVIIRDLMSDGLKVIGAGVLIGLIVCVAVGRLLTTFVGGGFGDHVATSLFVAMAFAGFATGACYLPARRAAALDPVAALRAD